jgi:hypothetical protein
MTMPGLQRKRPPWVGFLAGLLAIVVPLAGFLVWKQLRGRPRPPDAVQRAAPAAPSPRAVTPGSISIDETGLVTSGASIEDATPPPSAAVLRMACARARDWLSGVRVDPFGGSGTDSLRLYALEVECWDRLAAAEPPGAEKVRLETEVRNRLQRVTDPERLRGRLGQQGAAAGLLECLLLAARCREHGVDPGPLVRAIEACRPALDRELDRLPPSMAALYAAAEERAGVAPRTAPSGLRSAGVLAARPREITMGNAAISGLVAELFAASDAGRRPLTSLTMDERAWLHRVLPHLAMAMTVLRRGESAADLISCMAAAGMTETYGYREGMRRLVERQNADGSFGEASAPVGRGRVIQLLAPTTASVTAISLERRRIGGAL